MYWYALAALLFVLSQLAWFLLGKVICKVRYFAVFFFRCWLSDVFVLCCFDHFHFRDIGVTSRLLRVPCPSEISCRSSFYGFFPSVVTPILTQLLQHTNARVDGSFIATILETATVAVIYMAWRSITEGAFRFVLGCVLVLGVVAFCDAVLWFRACVYGLEMDGLLGVIGISFRERQCTEEDA
jgi:hypothetical protein